MTVAQVSKRRARIYIHPRFPIYAGAGTWARSAVEFPRKAMTTSRYTFSSLWKLMHTSWDEGLTFVRGSYLNWFMALFGRQFSVFSFSSFFFCTKYTFCTSERVTGKIVSLFFFVNNGSWIFMARSVLVSTSKNQRVFELQTNSFKGAVPN